MLGGNIITMRRRSITSPIKKENKKIDQFLLDLFRLYKKHKLAIVQKNKKDPFIVANWSKEEEEWMRNAIDGTTPIELKSNEDRKN